VYQRLQYFTTHAESILKRLSNLNHLNTEVKVVSGLFWNQAAEIFGFRDEAMKENTNPKRHVFQREEQIAAIRHIAADQSEMKRAMTNTINIMAMRAHSLSSEDEQISSAQKKTNQQMIKLFTNLTIWSTVTADWNDPNWCSWNTRAPSPP
jgi:hypothetical protein